MNLRKYLAAVMAAVMTLALLTACSGDPAPADTTPAEGSPSAEASAPAESLPGTGTTYDLILTNHDSDISKGALFCKDLTDMMSAYVAEHSTDRLEFTLFNGGSLYGATESLSAVIGGSADMAWIGAPFYSGTFPVSEFLQLPLNGLTSAQHGSKVYTDMVAEIPECAGEYKDLRLIEVQGNCSGLLSTTKAYGKIESIDDLKGLQFRTAGSTAALWVSAVGMEPVTVATSDTYEYLEKNIVNGCMNDWHNIDCFRLYEVLGYVMDYPVSESPMFLAMNPDTYNNLPEHVQQAIDLYSGSYASDMAGWYWDTCVFSVSKEMGEHGVEIYEPTQELYDFMTSDSIREQVHTEYIAYLDSYGYDGQAIYDKCMEIVARYADQYADVFDTEITIEQWAGSDIAAEDLAANAAALGITLE